MSDDIQAAEFPPINPVLLPFLSASSWECPKCGHEPTLTSDACSVEYHLYNWHPCVQLGRKFWTNDLRLGSFAGRPEGVRIQSREQLDYKCRRCGWLEFREVKSVEARP